MSRPGPASAPEPPSVVVGHHPDTPAPVLREVLAGAEEEGVPVTTWPDPAAAGGPDGLVALAHRAAQRSRLDVGVGIDADGSVVVHHTKLPTDRPAFTEPAPGPAGSGGPGGSGSGDRPHGRHAGAAAARIVTGLPLPGPAGVRP
ncbi:MULTISPECIES: glycerol dehydratase reactivase beta/small subunit family protein [unclassified Pseudonocardia]|uniref:glycerol dehydratase reactivase beta/small subunit family protein n=1 Tax=unclassified Pseudonocardia TaxID=2619320 RepID=UPI001CF6C6E8|nr:MULTISPECIES: glycerol dehydratase reactivase beta/small subunit family protein [unclassified Pseudonocardia]